MPNVTPPLDGLRIAVVGTDAKLLDEHMGWLREVGAITSPRPQLSELAAAAERCGAVVVFADEFADEVIRARLDGIDRWHDGPLLVVVSDAPSPWKPTHERARPAITVTRSEWRARLVDLVASRA
jgi:hypothetical protein